VKTIGDLIGSGLAKASNEFTAYLVALGVISALTMALLQAVKELTPLRARYNRWRLRKWLEARAVDEHRKIADAAEKELLRLATDGDAFAFYSAELDSLSGQFSSAAQLVMDYPRQNEDLFRLLALNATEADVKLLLKDALPHPVPLAALEQQTPGEMKAAAEKRQEIIDARNRVRHQITQSIASFQMTAASRWQMGFKVASWVVSTILVGVAIGLATPPAGTTSTNSPGVLIATAAFSGFLAPVARDLLVALQNLRK
jgi:hypothetical protein